MTIEAATRSRGSAKAGFFTLPGEPSALAWRGFRPGGSRRSGFTLIEILVAVGIMVIFMSIGIPSLYRSMNQDSMRKAVQDVLDACTQARDRAILDGKAMELRIRPGDRQLSVGPAAMRSIGESSDPQTFAFEGDNLVERPRATGVGRREDYQWGDRMRPHGDSGSSGGGSFSVKLSQNIVIKGLGVNGEDWTDDDEALVRFYPNGTCDEMSIVLLSDKGELRNIWLEVVTGYAEMEVDPAKFRDR